MSTKRLVIIASILVFSCAPLLASAEGHGSGWGWLETAGRWVNLLILGGGLFYFLREPARQFFSNRRSTIRKQLRQAEEARREAEAHLARAEEKMQNLDAELEALREQARRESELEMERIKKQAEEEAQRILLLARKDIETLRKSVRQDLKDYAAELAVELATDQVRARLDSGVEASLLDQFFAQLPTSRERN